MKFDHTDWKILAFQDGKKRFFDPLPAISDDFVCHLWNCFALQPIKLKSFILKI